ncbi:MAG: serine hydrolase [Bacteroidales bacterium]|nr:serine hydrolase [Bacteroidales bacterium]
MKKYLSFFLALSASVILVSCTGRNAEIVDLPRAATPASIKKAVDDLLAGDAADESVLFESLMVLKHGKVIYEDWYGDAAPDKPHAMYSVSKSFTATAVGMAADAGLLKVTDKLVDFFPDKLPAEVSDNLKAVTIYDLLTMNCGQETEARFRGSDDWVAAFLAHPFTKEPGTWYCYNSLGTYMLSAIVQKLTGEKVLDYLTPRLFEPLHIEIPEWEESPQGINAGGWGLQLKTEDMAKFGQLFLQNGVWNGKQLVSKAWVEEASKYQVPSVPAGTRPDEIEKKGLTPQNCTFLLGYGYQMWRCPDNAYRADGARGQYIIIVPDSDAVIAVTANSSNLQAEQDLIYKYLFPALAALE